MGAPAANNGGLAGRRTIRIAFALGRININFARAKNMSVSDYSLSTDEFSKAIKVKPQSIRVRLCETGSYFGIHPIKLRNGRLLWPSDGPERLAANPRDKHVGAHDESD